MTEPIDDLLQAIAAKCGDLNDALAELALTLTHGGGELTPDQYRRLAEPLASVGMNGGAILEADLARTARRAFDG